VAHAIETRDSDGNSTLGLGNRLQVAVQGLRAHKDGYSMTAGVGYPARAAARRCGGVSMARPRVRTPNAQPNATRHAHQLDGCVTLARLLLVAVGFTPAPWLYS
jgi:hypothetical protein